MIKVGFDIETQICAVLCVVGEPTLNKKGYHDNDDMSIHDL